MKSKKNLAATLAFLMTLQATGQPWAVLANEVEDNGPIIGGATDGQTADVLSDDVAIEEPVQEPVTTDPVVQAPVEAPAAQEMTPTPEETAPVETAPVEEEAKQPEFQDMETTGQAPVQAVADTGRVLDTVRTMDLGKIGKDTAPKAENAEFDYADVDNNGTRITEVRRWENDFFYTVENSDAAAKLEPGQTIVLHYTDTTPKVEDSESEKEQPKEDTADKPAKAPAANADTEKKEQAYLYFYYFTEGSNVPVLEQQKVEHGQQTITLKQKKGYTLYYADAEGNKKGEAPATLDVNVQGDQEFTFVYVPGEAEYTVKYIYPGGKVETEKRTGKVGTMTDVQAPEKDGHTRLYYSNSIISPEGDTVVEVEYAAISYTLNFNSNGGSFVNSKEFTIGQTVALNEVPVREGYEFAGWTLNGKDVKTITIANVPEGAKAVTVDAEWKAKEVNYTVRYWKQRVTDDVNAADADKTYDYSETATKKALTGSEVDPSNDKDWTGFRYNRSNSSKTTTIAADGSTVIDVRYDRIKCTAEFEYSRNNTKTYIGLFGAPFADADGKSLWDSSKMWQTSRNGALLLTTYDFHTAGYQKETKEDGSGNWSLKFTVRGDSSHYHIAYYNEQYDGSYQLADTIMAGNGSFNVYEKYAGYKLYKYSTKSSGDFTSAEFWLNNGTRIRNEGASVDINWGTPTKVASNLEKYNIQYSSWNTIVKEVKDVKYTTPLGKLPTDKTGAEGWDYEPERPAEKGSYYRFVGWYLDPAFTQPATDSVTMPNDNLILYAKWEAEAFDVTLHYNNGSADKLLHDDIEGGSRIGEITEKPEFAGHTFAGWYMDEECTIPFSADKTVEGDTHIYAKWTAQDTMPVTVQHVNAVTGDLLDEETVTARPNKTITVQAKSYTDMSPEESYIRYTVDPGKDNVIVFKYHPVVQKYYKVVYVDANDNDKVIASGGTLSNHMKEEFTVKADAIPENYELAPGEPSVQVVNSKDLSADADKPSNVVFRLCKKKLQLTYDVNAEGLISVYDGNNHVLPAGTTNLATGKVVYSRDNGANWSEKLPATTDAATIDVQVKATDPAGNYADSDVVTVQLVVTPREITAKALDATKVYDGKPLTGRGGIVGLVKGEEATVRTSGSQTDVGSSTNKFEGIDWNGTAKKDNYKLVESTDGTLTVTPAPADQNKITFESGETTYNGQPQTLGKDATGGKEGTTYQYALSKDSTQWSDEIPAFTDANEEGYIIWVKGEHQNYETAYAQAKLKIKKATLTATAGSKTEKYTGKAITAEGTIAGLVNGETAEAVTSGSQTEVGESTNKVSEITWGTAKEANYKVTYVDGTLKVTEADAEDLGLKFADKEFVYAATNQKLDPATVTVAEGTKITYSTDRKTWTEEMPVRYDAGEYTIYARAENKNYNTAEVSAVLTITQAPLKITTDSAERKYTGEALTAGGKLEGLAGSDNDTVEFKVTGSQTNVGESKNTYSIDWNGVKADNYALAENLGTLKVTTAPAEDLKLVFESKTERYTAKNQSLNAATAIDGAVIEYSEDGVIWTTKMPSYRDVKDGGYKVIARAVKDGYETATKEAVLTITPAPVTVTTKSDRKVYDSKALTAGGQIEGILGDDKVEFSVTGSQTEAGSSVNTYDLKWTRAKSTNYTVSEKLGELTVEKAEGSITINDGDKNITVDGIKRMYDGTTSVITAKTDAVNDKETTFEYLVNGKKVEDTPSFKDVVKGTVTVKATNPNYNFAEKGVTVDVVITPRPVTLTSAALAKVYDGTALNNGDNKLAIGGVDFADGEGLANVEFSASITNVKESGAANAFDYTLNEETTKASNYTITKSEGSLSITPRTVLLRSERASKVYDGTPLTNNTVIELDGSQGFVDGEFDTYKFAETAIITNVGEAENAFEVVLTEGKSLDNYDIQKTFGLLEVTDANGTIDVDPGTSAFMEGNNIHKIYDGKEVELTVVTKNSEKDVIVTDYSYVVNGEAVEQLPTMLDAGEWTITFKPKDENLKNLSKTVTVTIEQRKYTVTTDGAEKVYDGSALTAADITIENIVDGETFSARTTGSQTNVGESANTYSLAFDGTAKASNYKLADEKLGLLKVTAAQPTIDITPDAEMEITATGFRKKYNGQPTTVAAAAKLENGEPIDGNFTYTVKNLETGETTTTAEAPAFTNSGKWEVTATTGNNNCKETSKTVTVEILKRNVLLVSEDQEWVYDGTEHRHEKAYVHESGDGFVEGEEPEFHSFATITDAGSRENSFSYRFNKRSGATTLSRVARFLGIASEDPDNIAANYNIEVQHGTLKVKKADAKHHNLTLADKTVTYNGKDQMLDAATSDIKDAKIQYSVDGQTWMDELPAFTHVGKCTVKARAMHNNYEDAETSAVLEVVPAKLTVTTESAEKVYDGKALTAGGSVTGLAEGDEVELLLTGSQTEVGESANTYELKWTKADAADYEVTEAIGTLKVTPKPAEPAEPEAPKKDETPKAPEKSETKKANKVATALGLDPALWTSIMGAAGLGMIGAAHLSRKDKKKKDEE
ncbi:InlB B-repeat-containing protein [Faecalibaculum rodentium]|uniref:InlB B-repeat-containing protein n=4 Tax=Faecalibaculum rodentium TaxID=1702221 RepID=UPI00262A3D4C|nr:InlB B-repeat-containing protein [Faecalibaculum rodentium]